MRFFLAFTPMVTVSGFCLIAVLAYCLWPVQPTPEQPQGALERSAHGIREPIQPIATAAGLNLDKVSLGKRLFHDTQLSRDNTISCASCHGLRTAGVDGRPHSRGIHHREGSRNAPTVFNAALNYRQFWDGRAASLEAQVAGPLHDPAEMGSDWPEVTRKLQNDTRYTAAFSALYTNGVQPNNITDAIATYERSLVTPDATFDRFLRGDRTAISEQSITGYQRFKSYGCVSCHQGANVGGNLRQQFGVLIDPAAIHDRGQRQNRRLVNVNALLRQSDIASDTTAKTDGSHTLYKVPGLRNIARTGPYFHDGSVQNLPEAVRIMGLSQLGCRLPERDVADIVAFLKTLTGKYEGETL